MGRLERRHPNNPASLAYWREDQTRWHSGDRLDAVIGPRVGIERAVPDVPHRRAAKLVRSRSRLNLDLSVAATELGIDGREDHADFADEVGVDDRRGLNACGPSAGGA